LRYAVVMLVTECTVRFMSAGTKIRNASLTTLIHNLIPLSKYVTWKKNFNDNSISSTYCLIFNRICVNKGLLPTYLNKPYKLGNLINTSCRKQSLTFAYHSVNSHSITRMNHAPDLAAPPLTSPKCMPVFLIRRCNNS